jgi:aminoglycoside/choline kinase family phosphotransferase
MNSQSHQTYAHVPERVQAYLARTGLADRSVRVVPITGDASDRQYFRVIEGGTTPFVLALYAAPFKYHELSFINVTELLDRVPLPAPTVLGHADDLGILALQDLGDVTLQAHLGAGPAIERAALYREAVSAIELLQRRGQELSSPRFVPYSIAFDVEKLTWELEFFVKHFMVAYRGAAIPDNQREAFRDEWKPIVGELAAEPRVLCHRDYHSRNLMLHEGLLYLIDFQDARMGPDTYDLASLLRDSYVDLTEEVVNDLLAYFLALKGRNGMHADPAWFEPYQRDFRRRFDLMSLQRNLKALGTFGYQTATRQNPVYIQYIPRTIQHVRCNLERYTRFGRLRELLARFIEELA